MRREPINPPEGPDPFASYSRSVTQLRQKIDGKSPATMGLPVVRIFQRHPFLADSARATWQARGSMGALLSGAKASPEGGGAESPSTEESESL